MPPSDHQLVTSLDALPELARAAPELDRLDRAIIELLAERTRVGRQVPPHVGDRLRTPEIRSRVDHVVALYTDALGPGGELVARAVLALGRGAQRQEA